MKGLNCLLIGLLIAACVTVGYLARKPVIQYVDSPIQRDTVWRQIIKHDTIVLVEPETRFISKIETVKVYLPGEEKKVPVRLDFEERTYKGEYYTAVVYGYKPELRKIDIRQKERTITETHTIYSTKPPVLQAGLVVGSFLTQDFDSQYIAGSVQYNKGRVSVGAIAGYDPFHSLPVMEARIGIDLFRQ